MYKAASEEQSPFYGFVKILKGSAIASAGGILLIIILFLASAVIINAAIPDPDSYVFFFLLAAVGIGCLVTGYASAALSGGMMSGALLSGIMITLLSSAAALLFGGPLTFGRHLIMIICICAFSCAGGLLKSRAMNARKHSINPKKPVKRPVKRKN